MALLYADEGFPIVVSKWLRVLGHDVLTVQQAEQDNQRIPDSEVLTYATSRNRAVLSVNRIDFIKLHRTQPDHAGIVVCTEDFDREGLAKRIDVAIQEVGSLSGKLVRVNRPHKP